jgi:hypothetical protein
VEFLKMGTLRIGQAMEFAAIETGKLKEQYLQERQGWGLYYDMLTALEKGIRDGDPFAEDIRRKAQELINGFALPGEKPPALID